MIALWMVYATLVTSILTIAGALLDRAASATLRQRRWIWMVALALSAAIPSWTAVAPRIGLVRASRVVDPASLAPTRAKPQADASPGRLAELIARAEPQALGRWDATLAGIWLSSALLALTGYVAASWYLARRRRTWRTTDVDGVRVMVAPATGPAVMGALRPMIVLPEWALTLDPDQRALMLEHERQHVRARDPLALHAAASIALLMPWNPAAWWLIRRLRLAIELDCDARVLAAGRDARAYGTLLLDVCARGISARPLLAPALFERTSSLTTRILAMRPDRRRFPRARLALGVTAALVVAILACDMPSPEALAPDGTNQSSKRVYGQLSEKIQAAGELRATEGRALVARYFPAIARGDGGPSILFIVRSSTGDVVLTESQPLTEFTRTPVTQLPGASAAPTERALRARAEAERARSRMTMAERPTELRVAEVPRTARPSGVLFKTPSNTRAALPAGVGALVPNDIAAIDVSKHAAGVLSPNAVSLITIVLKPGAAVPPVAPR